MLSICSISTRQFTLKQLNLHSKKRWQISLPPLLLCLYCFIKTLCSFLRRLDKSVAAVLSLVNNVYVVAFGVAEHIELMSEHIHLQDSFINRFGLEDNSLCSYNVKFRFLVICVVENLVK